jgi:hypothetical protein
MRAFLVVCSVSLLVVASTAGPGRAPAGRAAQPTAALEWALGVPVALRGAALSDAPPPPTARPRASATPTPDLATPTPTPSPTATALPDRPGVPDCARTAGDAGGFRFSRDGGRSLAPNERAVSGIAYTWDIDVHPTDPDEILELHQGRLFRTRDAGCTFAEVPIPAGNWDAITRAASDPDVIVLSSIFASRLAYSDDGGASWETAELPDDVLHLAIAPDDAWRWTFAGRVPGLWVRPSREARWEARPLPDLGEQQLTSADHAPAAPGTWLVGTMLAGLYRTEDEGQSWEPTSRGLFEPFGGGQIEVGSVVVVSITCAPSNPDIAYTAVNQVPRDVTIDGRRGIWRSTDGGRTWALRVVDGQSVDGTPAEITGGTRVFVSPYDPDHAFFAFGSYIDGYGTDLFRSHDGLASLEVSHFDDFYELLALAFGPPGSDVIFVGASSDVPPRAAGRVSGAPETRRTRR